VIITYGIHGNNPIVPANEQDQNGPQYLCLIPKQGDSNQTPILFAPGYMESPEGLQGTCQRLADATGRRVYVVKYTSRFQSIDEHANDIATVAQQIFKEMNQLNQRDTSSLILGGHSMGGLSTGRYLTQAAGLGVTIEHWFTIATPLNGAPIARIGAGACAKDMIPGSVFLRALHTDLEAISVPSIHFYSHADLIVPPDYAQFNGKQMQVSGIDFGHMSIKESPQIMGQIAATIGSGR
jgi:triacylglycerol esterase/lipase EstA (alpha/beta hydrolase family)